MTKTALITGAAGFIGSHLVDDLLKDGWNVTAVDNFDPFYDEAVKRRNIATHLGHPAYSLVEGDIRRPADLERIPPTAIDVIVHLAARAGVRPSIADPLGYQDTNVAGTQNLLEFARLRNISQFVFASSSSVYGVNPRVPWREVDHVLMPISPYASTKVSGELLGHVYTHLYGIRFVALRFFTVYGPRQRPDLAIHKFARQILSSQPIQVFGDGSTRRDYTYISDIVAGIRAAMDYRGDPYTVLNLGNNHTVSLAEMIATLERTLGRTATMHRVSEQPGDVPQTWADVSAARDALGYAPSTSFDKGVAEFVRWLDAEGNPSHEHPR